MSEQERNGETPKEDILNSGNKNGLEEILPSGDNVDKMANKEDESDLANISKHKQSEKHALKHDSIFKGRKDEVYEESYTETYFNEDFTHDPSSLYHHESINNQQYIREKDLKEKVYKILSDKTELEFDKNRRKPSRNDFNHYYTILRNELDEDKFTFVEIFNELSYYFSDNLYNMFKLLDPIWRNSIFIELRKHVGEVPEDWDEIKPKNLTKGAEIEFEIEVEREPSELDFMKMENEGVSEEDLYETRLITGVIDETDHDMGEYTVDSYEDIYVVPIECITKIYNNRKHKYNLNKLQNLDIL